MTRRRVDARHNHACRRPGSARRMPSHKVEHSTRILLRPKRLRIAQQRRLPRRCCDCACLANLSQPETPQFLNAAGIQRATMDHVLHAAWNALRVSILSHAYWGLGLFNSGYLNVIEFTGPFHEQRMRFLVRSAGPHVGRNPWEFKHRGSRHQVAGQAPLQGSPPLSGNESSWREGIGVRHGPPSSIGH